MTTKAITANRLRDGFVVYLARDGGWSDWIDDARVAATDEEEAELLASAARAVADALVVNPYAIEVGDDGGAVRPLHIKEAIRARGPTSHPDFGKQAVRR